MPPAGSPPPGWGGAPGYPPAWGGAPGYPPGHPASPSRSDLLRSLSTFAIVVALVVAVAPLGPWFTLGFGGLEASVNGFGQAQDNGLVSSTDSSDSFDTSSASADDSGSSDFGWIADPMADGVPISGVAALVVLVAWLLRARSLARPPGDPERDRDTRSLAIVCLVVGLAGLAWVVWSWMRFDQEFHRSLRASMEGNEFAALFLGAVHVDPGFGLYGAGLGLVALAIAGFVVLRRLQAAGPVGWPPGAPTF